MKKTAILLALLLGLSACGGGGETSAVPTASPGGSATPPAASVPVEPAPSAGPEASPAATQPPAAEPTPEPLPGNLAGPDYDFSRPVPEWEEVDEDYFADAAFVGDSRTEGFRLYSGLAQGDFFTHTGLMIFRINRTEITVDGEKTLILDAMSKKEYKKVYVSLGVNELGMYDDQGYHDCFAQFVDDVRAQQPEAVIYLQLNIPVNTEKCAEKKQPAYVTNAQIQVFNDILRQVAVEKHVFLLDPAEAIVDETGEPPYDITADGVHFQRAGYQQWYQYLRTHTVEKGDWE